MVVDSGIFAIDGYQGEPTDYLVSIESVEFNDGWVDIEIGYEREGDSAYVDDLVAVIRRGVEYEERFDLGGTRDHKQTDIVTIEADIDDVIDVGFETPNWDIISDEWLSFGVPFPDEVMDEHVGVSTTVVNTDVEYAEIEVEVSVSSDSPAPVSMSMYLYEGFTESEFSLGSISMSPGDSYSETEGLEFDYYSYEDVDIEFCGRIDNMEYLE